MKTSNVPPLPILCSGETLCDEKAPIILERMDFPDPVIKIAIEPKSKVGTLRVPHLLGCVACTKSRGAKHMQQQADGDKIVRPRHTYGRHRPKDGRWCQQDISCNLQLQTALVGCSVRSLSADSCRRVTLRRWVWV